MNANPKVQAARPAANRNQVTLRPERLVCASQPLPPDPPHSRFARMMLTVMGTLRGRKLI